MVRILIVLAALSLGGCAPTVISMPPYQPVTTAELSGVIEVKPFKYFPKKGIKPNVIRNTAAGELQITENVSDYIANSVRREFRQAGLSLKNTGNCYLEGEINDLTIDDLGYSATFSSDFRYILWDRKNTTLLDKSYQEKFDTSKFVVAEIIFANLNKVISSNIAQLLQDPQFEEAVAQHCQVL